tara:strand:+ start:845 stop:3550 length:2706 start_codon:yes stop_codon:yes gene_type:complete
MDSKPTYQELEVQIEKLKQYNDNSQPNSSIQNGDVYRILINNMSEGFAHCQMIYENNKPTDYIYLEVNDAFEKLIGFKNIVGKRISEVIANHRAENAKLFDLYSRVSQTGISEKIESFIESMGLWFSISVYSSQKNQFLVVLNNITIRKQSEEVLRISEQKYRTLADNAPDIIFRFDHLFRHTYVNAAVEKATGIPKQTFLGKDHRELGMPEDIVLFFQKHIRKVFESGQELEFSFIFPTPTGEHHYESHYVPEFAKDGTVEHVMGITRDVTEPKQAVKTLKESESRFKQLIKNSFDMIILMDSEGIQHFISESCEKILGYKPEELIGIPVIEKMIHPEDQELTKKGLLDIITNNKKGGTQYRHLHKNGNWVYLEAYGNNQLDNPEIKSVVLNVRDITERKYSAEKLKESEKKYKELVETADIAILIDDENGFFKFFNNKFCEIFGFTRKEIEQLPIRKLVHPDDVELVMNHHNNRIRGEKVKTKYEFRGVRKNGTTVHLMVSVVSVKPNGKIIGSQSYIWDITERKHMEAVLLENKHRNEKSQALGHVGNWEYNLESKLLWVSDESKKIFGFNLGSNNFSLEQTESCIPERERVHQALIDLIDHDNKYDLEYEIIPADKTPRRIIHSIAELERDASNNPIRVRGVILDITERKQASQIIKENEIRLKEINATKDKLFSIIAHDLRSPFNGILGFSELLIENIKDFEITESEKYLEIINSSAQNTLILLDNLLNWAKLQTGQIIFNPQKINLLSIIGETIELSKTGAIGKDILISQNKPDDIEVYADKDMLETVLRNLISNAIKFTKPGGNISVLAKKKQSHVEIAISDNGVGMNEETINKLFRIETNNTTIGTADEKGSGLGLILCKELVEKQEGKIWVESELGKGSAFKFILPMNKSCE